MVEAESSQKYVYYALAYGSYYVAWLHLHYLWCGHYILYIFVVTTSNE